MLALLLVGSNVLLLIRYSTVQRALQEAVDEYRAANYAPAGRVLPILPGRNAAGESLSVDPSASGQFLLLLFDPFCRACDENWPRWKDLLNHEETKYKRAVLFVSTSQIVPREYVENHEMQGSLILAGLADDLTNEFHLRRSPQTILVRRGRIVRSWGGVLSKTDLSEIQEALLVR